MQPNDCLHSLLVYNYCHLYYGLDFLVLAQSYDTYSYKFAPKT